MGGLRVTTVPETLLLCASHLALLDLVVLIDGALHLRWCTLGELGAVAEQRRRGAPLLREALTWCEGRSESAWETLLRVLLASCGVPVTPQVDLFDETGVFVARADLLIVGTRTLMEYDGSGHLKRDTYRSDRRRDGRLMRSRHVRHGWTAQDVMRAPGEILAAADVALGRAHDPGRLSTWHRLLAGSLFSATGQAAFLDRVGTSATQSGSPAAEVSTSEAASA